MKRLNLFQTALFIIAAIGVTGCGKNEATEPSTPATATYVGTMASGTESGSISLTLDLNGGVVSGMLTRVQPTATTIVLSGSFTSNVLQVRGGGYTFTGSLVNGNIVGSYDGPNGGGQFTTQASINNSVRVFTGTYTATVVSQLDGTFNIVINGTTITGWAISSNNQDQMNLAGTLQDSTITIHESTTGAHIATGTMHGSSSVSGTYNATTNQGNWSGDRVS